MNAIHIVCPWSTKNCSVRSKVSAAILKLVFSVNITLWMTSQPISFRHFPILLLKTSSFWGSSLPCQPPVWGHPKYSIGGRYGTARGSISIYGPLGLRPNWCLCLCPFHLNSLLCLCSSSGLNPGRLILFSVCPNSSLLHNSSSKVPISIHLCSQFHWGDSLLVTDGLDELVTLLFWLFAARRPLSAFLFAVFLASMHRHTWQMAALGNLILTKWSKIDTFPRSIFFPADLSKGISALLENKPLQAWHDHAAPWQPIFYHPAVSHIIRIFGKV